MYYVSHLEEYNTNKKNEKCPQGRSTAKCFQIAKVLYLAILFKYNQLRELF